MAKGSKTGGRQKGTPNKVSGTVKEMINQAISNELQNLPKLLTQLEPKDKAEFIIKVLPYVLPKIAPVEVDKMSGGGDRSRMIHQMFKQQIAQNTPSSTR